MCSVQEPRTLQVLAGGQHCDRVAASQQVSTFLDSLAVLLIFFMGMRATEGTQVTKRWCAQLSCFRSSLPCWLSREMLWWPMRLHVLRVALPWQLVSGTATSVGTASNRTSAFVASSASALLVYLRGLPRLAQATIGGTPDVEAASFMDPGTLLARQACAVPLTGHLEG